MAEIRIQEKKSPIWPWILVIILIVAAIIWFLMANKDDDNDMDIIGSTDTTMVDTSDTFMGNRNSEEEVNDFAEFVRSDTTDSIDENYVRTGFDHMLNSINAVITDQNISDTTVTAQRDSLENYVDDLESEEIVQNRENVRKAFVSAAGLLQSVQQKNFPDLKSDADDLKKTANNMRGKNLDQQKKQVKEFFSKASETLSKMVRAKV